MIRLSMCISLLLLKLASGDFIDPYVIGSHDVINYKFLEGTIEGLEPNLMIWAPQTPGTYPVVYVIDGMAMTTPAFYYAQVLNHIASHGFAVVAPWTRSMTKPSEQVPVMVSLMDWAGSNLENVLYEQGMPTDISFDFDTLLAFCHSAGGHVTVSYLKESCGNFKGLALNSPVDGADPFGIIHDYCITPGEQLNFIIPTLHIQVGFDDHPGAFGVACAPKKLSNERFWDALNADSQRWYINATEFSHLDLLDDEYRIPIAEIRFCAINDRLPESAFVDYRRFVAGSSLAFYKALLEDEYESYLQYIEDASIMNVDTLVKHVNPSGDRPKPFCSQGSLKHNSRHFP